MGLPVSSQHSDLLGCPVLLGGTFEFMLYMSDELNSS